MSEPSVTHIEDLSRKVADHEGFEDLLVRSLTAARDSAAKDLAPSLFAALDWPVTLQGYVDYLIRFSRWKPQQSTDSAWTAPGTDEQQEVYDRLCHFYFLIDQPVGIDPQEPRIVQNVPWFAEWLIGYANLWGTFLNTTASFNDEILQSFIDNSPKYEIGNSMIDGRPNNPSGWLTFNQFFARELNPGLRPISAPADNRIPVCPADCTYKAHYAITENSTIPEIKVKKTHGFASIPHLLQDSPYGDAYAGGTFVHYFLGPYSYHRFHAPVAGAIKEARAIKGEVYLAVNLKDGQFDAPDGSADGYEFTQARGIITYDTSGSQFSDIGLVTVIPVGMCQVSSVNMTATVGAQALKGDEFGYFLFGGSDIIVLFQKGMVEKLDLSTEYRRYGTPIATLRS